MRLIDADTLVAKCGDYYVEEGSEDGFIGTLKCLVDMQPTIGGWISVKDDLPKEHDSIFANHTHLSKHMWAKESDNVIVYVRFPDGTGRSTEGRLQDGKWWTRVSPMLEPVVTHWMPLPTPPEVKQDD